ncbi:hypothetical protein NN561_020125 [Cricetulus griseus]
MQQACKAPLGSGRSPFPCFVVPPTWKGKQSPQLALAPIAISIRKGGASCNPIQALLSRTRHKNRLRSGTNEEKSEHSPQPVAEHRGQTQTPPTHAGRVAKLGSGEREVGTQPLRGVANCVTLLNRLASETRHPFSAIPHLPSRHCRRLQPDGSDSGGGSSSRNGGSGGLRGGLCSSPKPCGRSKCLLPLSV